MILSDIVVIAKPTVGQPLDPFTLVNRAYLSHVSGRPDSFISVSSEPEYDPDDSTRFLYHLNVTLLPNQILILPSHLEERLNPEVFNSKAVYSDSDIR